MTFPTRILAAIDFDEVSEGALKVALDLARTTKASLCVMTAVGAGSGTVEEAEAKRHLARLLEPHLGGGVALATHVGRGAPGDAIVETVRAIQADVVVMGTHARPSTTKLGSVAEAVTRTSPVPVMVVRGKLPRS